MPRRGWAVPIAAAVIIASVGIGRSADGLPEGVTCADVRRHFVQYGETFVTAAALARGYTMKDIRRIKRVCGL